MPFIYIDRRKAGKGKSTPNRQKLIKRIRGFVKTSTPTSIGASVAGNNKAINPVKVGSNAVEEPWFAYGRGGESTEVHIGNKEFDRGDEIIMDSGDGQPQAGPGANGEDDFIVNVASSEFLDLFFEDCELPNLENEKVTDKIDTHQQHAGFSTTGSPAQLSIVRSYKQSLGRRWALMAPYKEELDALESEMKSIYDDIAVHPPEDMVIQKWSKRLDEIEARIVELRQKIAQLNGFDKVDLRFKKKEHKPLNTVDAVLVMIMDISGSMDEQKKIIARRWFALLYAFIKRRYGAADLIFIAHTEEAFEMSESEFFSTRVNGGTMVSPALKLTNKIIKERFDPTQTNIYVSHASDGDNWSSDNDEVVGEMIGQGHLLDKLQYFSYVEVGKNGGFTWTKSGPTSNTNLWDTYAKVQDKTGASRMSMAVIEHPEDCYTVFRKVFKKK